MDLPSGRIPHPGHPRVRHQEGPRRSTPEYGFGGNFVNANKFGAIGVRKKSALRKLLDKGLFFTKGESWEIFPLATNLFVLIMGGRIFLSNGEESKEYPDFASALQTQITKRRLIFGDSLQPTGQ
jgi:hypothetical protein